MDTLTDTIEDYELNTPTDDYVEYSWKTFNQED
jgi:hypothetical protein